MGLLRTWLGPQWWADPTVLFVSGVMVAVVVKNAYDCEGGQLRLDAAQRHQLGKYKDIEGFTKCDPVQDAIQHFLDPGFVVSVVMFVAVCWLTHGSGRSRPLTAADSRVANWYLMNAVFIHFLMDGLVGALFGRKAWRLMGREYAFLDRRFHPDTYNYRWDLNESLVPLFRSCNSDTCEAHPEMVTAWTVPYLTGLCEATLHCVTCILAYVSIHQKRPHRRVFEILALTLQFVGTFFFVWAEDITGGRNFFGGKGGWNLQDHPLTVNHFFYFWFGVVVNYVWAFIPGYLLYLRCNEVAEGYTAESIGETGHDVEVEQALLFDEDFVTEEDDDDDDDDIDALIQGAMDQDQEPPSLAMPLGRRAAARAAAAASIVAMAAVEAAADRAAEAAFLDGPEGDDEDLETHDSLLQSMLEDAGDDQEQDSQAEEEGEESEEEESEESEESEEEESEEEESEEEKPTPRRRASRKASTPASSKKTTRASTPTRRNTRRSSRARK